MDQKKIGKYIAEKRKSLGMTQIALADKLDVSDKSVSKWERGICLPDASKYQPLCENLGISLNEFFAGEDIPAEEMIVQSEQNLIGVEKYHKSKRKHLQRIIVLLVVVMLFFSGTGLWVLVKKGYFKNEYIKPYALDNAKVASMIWTYGGASLYVYSTNQLFNGIEVEIVEYSYGQEIDRVNEWIRFTDEKLAPEGVIGFRPDLNQGVFKVSYSYEDGITITSDISVNVLDDEEIAGWAYSEIADYVEIEKNKKICLYAYLAGKESVRQVPISEIIKNPEHVLEKEDVCYLIYVSFK